ncbi:tyrosine-type recombinase/integrase [Desulforamulus hydrothermalis]|uniref:tyrosine-type recombinase/integrase n=1 Tax=Desulforamulus hydrothermalis TaxID=412895 RepID=UPI0002FBB04E|nr:site-specific integrase [Desulforamulus hydrothermalis]SHH43510.1 Phage integrase, N-terminal SAM-like domain [Desulforamulus hydrothermalis Lam5 = DSM 18033]
MKGLVRKRKDGRWEGRVELPPDPITGKRRQKYVYASKRQECQKLVNDIIYQLQTGTFADAGKLTIDAYLEQWFSVYCKKLETTTKEGYKRYIDNHIIPYFKGKKLKNLRPIHIEEFYNYEREKEYSEKTILQIHRIFSRALKHAVKNGLIPTNPCSLVDPPSPDDFEITVPDVSQFYAILDAARNTEHEIPVLLAGMCGLRREEVFGLTWNDIDFKNSTLTIRQVVVPVSGGLEVKPPKTKKSARTISVPADVLKVLAVKKSIGYVISNDGNPSHPGNYSHRFKNFLASNKLPHIRFHDLRHFHATLMLDADIDIRHVQNRLGHSNITMTSKYQHIRPKGDVAVVEKIDQYLRGGQNAGQKQN